MYVYTQGQNIAKPNNLKCFGARKRKDLNIVVKFGYCYLCLKENH